MLPVLFLVWDLQDDGNMGKTLRGISKWVYGCAWSPDAKTICMVGDTRSVSQRLIHYNSVKVFYIINASIVLIGYIQTPVLRYISGLPRNVIIVYNPAST